MTNIVSLKALRGAHLSPSQFEGSSEKLLIKEAEMSPQHYFRDSDGTPRPFYGPFSTSSGRPSPSSTPTPPPYCRTRTMSPIKSLPNQVSKEIELFQNDLTLFWLRMKRTPKLTQAHQGNAQTYT